MGSFTMSAGTINIINPNVTGGTKHDYGMNATTQNITGGQVIFGATGAPAASSYNISFGTAFLPNFTVNPTMTLNINNVITVLRGTSVTNNGAIISTGANARFDGVHDKASLSRLLGSELRADVDPLNSGVYDSAHLLGLSVERGLHGEKNNIAFLLQGGLGLSDRDFRQ